MINTNWQVSIIHTHINVCTWQIHVVQSVIQHVIYPWQSWYCHILYKKCYTTSNSRLYNTFFCYIPNIVVECAEMLLYKKIVCYIEHPNFPLADVLLFKFQVRFCLWLSLTLFKFELSEVSTTLAWSTAEHSEQLQCLKVSKTNPLCCFF